MENLLNFLLVESNAIQIGDTAYEFSYAVNNIFVSFYLKILSSQFF